MRWRRGKDYAPVRSADAIAEKGFVNMRFGKEPEEYQRRIGCFADPAVETVAEAGHNLQHDQPEGWLSC